jgi:hypothetical protein
MKAAQEFTVRQQLHWPEVLRLKMMSSESVVGRIVDVFGEWRV